MAHLHDESEWLEGQFSDDLAFKERIEQTKDDEEDEGDDAAGLELEEREIATGFLEGGLDAVDLLGLGLFQADLVALSLHRL